MGRVFQRRPRPEVVLTVLFVSVCAIISLSHAERIGQRYVRIKRQLPADSSSVPADLSASDGGPVNGASSETLAQTNTLGMDMSLAPGNLGDSSANNVSVVATTDTAQSAPPSVDIAPSSSFETVPSSSFETAPPSADTAPPSVDITASSLFEIVPPSFDIASSSLFDIASSSLFDIAPHVDITASSSFEIAPTSVDIVPSSSFEIAPPSVDIASSSLFDIAPPSADIAPPSVDITASSSFDIAPLSVDIAPSSSFDIAQSSSFDIAPPSVDITQSSLFDIAQSSSFDIAPPSVDIALSSSFDIAQSSSFDIAPPSVDIAQSSSFEAASSSLEFTPSSSSAFDQSDLPPVLWPSDMDTTMAIQNSEYLSTDSPLIDQTMTTTPSDLFSIVEATQASSDSLLVFSIVESQLDISHSDTTFPDESTTVLQESISPTATNSDDKSTFDLQLDSFSLDSTILSESSMLVHFYRSSAEFTASDDYSLVVSTDLLFTDSSYMYASASDSSEASWIPGLDVSIVLPSISDISEATTFIRETPELSSATAETFGSSFWESYSIEPSRNIDVSESLTVSESLAVDYSESLTPLYDSSTLLWDSKEFSSSQYATPVVPNWPDSLTSSPASTFDTQTSPTAVPEWDSTTAITEIYSTETSTVIDVTPSVSDSVSASSTPETSGTTTNPTNNTADSLPIKGASSDEGGLTTSGKIAIGILIPVAVICLVLFAVFFYRRYRLHRRGSKDFVNPAVRYRTYSNAAYKDDEVAVDGTWRSNY